MYELHDFNTYNYVYIICIVLVLLISLLSYNQNNCVPRVVFVIYSRDVSKQIRFECLLKTHSPLGQRAEALREALLAAWYRIFVEGFKNHLLIERNSIIISVHSDIGWCRLKCITLEGYILHCT